jgi:septum site-determining protein MinC
MSSSNTQSEPAAFELKGRMMTLSVLRLLSPQLDRIAEQLDRKIGTAPDFFRGLPVLLDFEALPGEALEVAQLKGLLAERQLIPVGVRGVDAAQRETAAQAGLGVISGGEPPRRPEPVREAAPAAPTAGMVVRQPVRSGQQVYARGGDLVVMASVSPGAEVLADGHVHIYGSLRGRALAGVQGNSEARIFCHSLDAELVAIAGNYRISENIRDEERGRPVHVYLDGDNLRIESI